MSLDIAAISDRLSQEAEAVCRHYLSHGHRQGHYWIVGDVNNTKGRSLFVRLRDDGSGHRAGKWHDAATGQYGDLIDLIGLSCGLTCLPQALKEAKRFLALPDTVTDNPYRPYPPPATAPYPDGTSHSARKLFRASRPIMGTIAHTYLSQRAIGDIGFDPDLLRFHPTCYYYDLTTGHCHTLPALIAAVSEGSGRIVGIQRIYLDPRLGALNGLGLTDGQPFDLRHGGKADMDSPKRCLGQIAGHGVRLGHVKEVMAVGEGLETVLSLKCLLPDMPMIAALSASNLSHLILPIGLKRLYILCDNDPAGLNAAGTLYERAMDAGIKAYRLKPRLNDLNDDLRLLGLLSCLCHIKAQLCAQDGSYLRPDPSSLACSAMGGTNHGHNLSPSGRKPDPAF